MKIAMRRFALALPLLLAILVLSTILLAQTKRNHLAHTINYLDTLADALPNRQLMALIAARLPTSTWFLTQQEVDDLSTIDAALTVIVAGTQAQSDATLPELQLACFKLDSSLRQSLVNHLLAATKTRTLDLISSLP